MSLRATHDKYAGFQAIATGVDSGRSPALLDSAQLVWLVNGRTRGGFVGPRPGMRERELSFLNKDFEVDAEVEANFKFNGRFQGAHSYIYDNGTGAIVASIGGRLFKISLDKFEVQDLTSVDPTLEDKLLNHPDMPKSYWVQAENFLVHQNKSDLPLIFDGSILRRSNSYTLGGDELPGGSVMTYNNGRIWLANVDGTAFIGGDQVYSDGTRAAVLKVTENQYLTGGGAFTNRGAFSRPEGIGPISSMTSIAVQDTATGHGTLQVFGPRGAFSVASQIPREAWQTTTHPIQSVSLLSAGATSPDATVLVNGDAWFRALDGIRSYQVAQRDHGTWVNTAVSREVDRTLAFDDTMLLEFASGALFDNRLLMTTAPFQKLDLESGKIRGIVHRGLVSLDFMPISQMFNRTPPVWDGLWTGLDILQILTVDMPFESRCFVFALNPDDLSIELWEVTRTERFDAAPLDNRIEWVVETPLYGFETGGWNKRKLGYADLWVNRIAGTVDIVVKYRCDSDPIWRLWKAFTVCSLYNNCEFNSCNIPAQFLEQYRTRIRLPSPDGECTVITDSTTDYGYRFAVRLEITGHCEIGQFRLVARDLPEEVTGACPTQACTSVGLVDDCVVDDFSYVISRNPLTPTPLSESA